MAHFRAKHLESKIALSFMIGVYFAASHWVAAGLSAEVLRPSLLLEKRGKLAGRVWVEGRLERPLPLRVYKNREFCGSFVSNESLLVSRERGLQNAVVTLHGRPREKNEQPLRAPVLDNKNCAFVPHVQVSRVGSELLILNSDPILHAVHARLGSETLFNIGLPTWRTVKKQLDRAGVIRVFCDVLHTWMTAFIVVTSSRLFAVSDAEGKFAIEGVPAGEYEMRVWHERLGTQVKPVTVSEGISSEIQVLYRLNVRDK